MSGWKGMWTLAQESWDGRIPSPPLLLLVHSLPFLVSSSPPLPFLLLFLPSPFFPSLLLLFSSYFLPPTFLLPSSSFSFSSSPSTSETIIYLVSPMALKH